jgi:pyruvate/2-oxoglutarate dehydrogenase complex dihydrolipoamide acyltransferase (E2) component
MATSAQTLMRIIEVMTDTRPKTVDKAIELLGGEGLLPAKLLADRVKITPKKVSRFASMEAEIFAMEQKISIPEGFVGSGKAGEGGKITIVDLRALLTGKTGKTAGEPKEPKAAKAPKEPKEPKAAKAPKETKLTKKVRDRLHEWGLDESALEGCTPTAYKGTKFSVDDIAHLEPGLATGGKGKKTATGKGKASSSASAQSAPSESSDSDSDDSDTEEQDDDDFDPFDAMKSKP